MASSTASAVFALFTLVLLSSGYILLRRCYLTRAHIFRSDGHALYFLVVVSAFGISLESALLWQEIKSIPELGIVLSGKMDALLHVFTMDAQIMRLGATAAVSLPLALFLAWILNLPLLRCQSLQGRLLFRLSCFSELEEFLWSASLRGLPVMITLGSSKVYVGYTMDEPPQSRDEKDWIRIEPLLSGYRGEDQRFQPVVAYTFLHEPDARENGVVPSDFDVLLPVSDIKSVHAFDLQVYQKHFQSNTEGGDSEADETDSTNDAVTPPTSSNGNTRARRTSLNGPRTKAERFYHAFVVSILITPLIELFYPLLVVGPLLVALIAGIAASLPETD